MNKQRPSHCGTKHCYALVVMLYEVGGLTTYQIAKRYGVPNSVFDRLNKSGKIRIKRGKGGLKKPFCKALLVMLYQFTDETVKSISVCLGIQQKQASKMLRADGIDIVCKGNAKKALEQMGSKLPENVRAIRYEGKYAVFECLTCGYVYRQYRDSKSKHLCPKCYAKQLSADKEARRAEKARRKQERKQELERLMREELAKDKVCQKCGCVFHSEYPTKRYCSSDCRKRAESRRKAKSRYARKRGVSLIDRSITLDRLIERDMGICQICGEQIDPNDKSWGTSGALYPSIDHIVALANGGAHTWDNVQLAHCLCNSIKGASA